MRIEYTANRMIFKNEFFCDFYILFNFLVCVTITLNIHIEVIAILRNRKDFVRDFKVLLLYNVSTSFKLRFISIF